MIGVMAGRIGRSWAVAHMVCFVELQGVRKC